MNELWYPWNSTSGQQNKPVFVSGSGYLIKDSRGREYIDAMSGALNANCGHGNQQIAEAALWQMRRIAHVDLSVAAHEPALELAASLAVRMPGGGELRHTCFVNSGSEATELAVKIAHDYWRNIGLPRRRIVSLADGYHGSTQLAKSFTLLPGNTTGIDIGFPVTRVPLPVAPRALRLGSPSGLLDLFRHALHAEPVAAVIVEPLLNVGGGVVLPVGFLKGLRDLCKETGTLLIADEIFCGFGRTGRMFGCDHDGIIPDVMTCSKGLSSGYMPIASVTARTTIYESYGSATGMGVLQYGHTTGGHAVACSAALQVLRIIDEQRLCANAEARGEQLLTALAPAAELPGIADVRGVGLVVTVEFATESSATRAAELAFESGVVVRRQGRHLMAVPPLIIDERGIAELACRMLGAIRRAISKQAQHLTTGGGDFVRRDSSPRLLLTHTRIAVAGASGSGKSTLAKRLAAMRGLPYVEMDALYYGSGWTPRANFSELADRHLCGEQWVTEWWYDEIIPLLVTRANLVIWLDYPLMLTATSVILRTLLRRLHHEVLWDGNREGGLLSALWNPHHALRYGLRGGRRLRQSLAAAIKASHGRFEIWRFTTPAQVSDWILAEQRRNTPNRSPKGAC